MEDKFQELILLIHNFFEKKNVSLQINKNLEGVMWGFSNKPYTISKFIKVYRIQQMCLKLIDFFLVLNI